MKEGFVYSRLLRTSWLIVAIIGFIGSAVLAGEPVFVGKGSMPQWSPSGKLILVLRSDSALIFDSKTLEVKRQLPLNGWQGCLWYNEDSLAVSSHSRTEAERPCDRWSIDTKGILSLDGATHVISQDTASATGPLISPWLKLPSGQVGCHLIRDGKPVEFLQPSTDGWKEVEVDTALSPGCKEAFAYQKRTMEVVPSPSCIFAYASSDSDNFAGIIDRYGVEVFKIGARVTVLPKNRYRFVSDPSWSTSGRYFSWTEEIEDGHYGYGSELRFVDLRDKQVTIVASESSDMILKISWSPTGDEFLLFGKADRSIWKFSLSEATTSNPELHRIGVGSMPQWSPDNHYISFIRNDSILVIDTSAVDKTKLLCTGAVGRYYWTEPTQAIAEIQYASPDSGSIGHISIILSCDIDGQTKVLSYDSTGSNPKGRSKSYRLERFSDGSIGYYYMVDSVEDVRLLSEANAQYAPDPGYYVRNTPYPNGPELQYTLLNHDRQCLYPRLAPTGDKFCCENDYGELVVYDTSGAFVSNLGRVDWSSWSSNGEWLIYDIMYWGHYDLIGSDVGIARFDGSRQQRLTFSNEGDQRASFSLDGKKVLFREGKTGEIFVLFLEE